jgi:hypothetical protein
MHTTTSALAISSAATRSMISSRSRLLRLLRMPRWWLAVLATLAAAGLHVAALGLGPLSLIQPLGVLTLVFALPLGARLAGWVVSRGEWVAAGWVALGLAGVGTVVRGGRRRLISPSASSWPWRAWSACWRWS